MAMLTNQTLVIVNPGSGGRHGPKLVTRFKEVLGDDRVCNILASKDSLRKVLEKHKEIPNLKILACGGDGTVGWLLAEMDKIDFGPNRDTWPAVAVIPLGTGNDLSRALGWGGSHVSRPVEDVLKDIAEAEAVDLDRWTIEISHVDWRVTQVLKALELTTPDLEQKFKPDIVAETKLPLSAFNNYFSFGVDAYISLLFDLARKKNPEKFKTRCQNRNYYFGQGSKQWFKRQFQDLMKTVTIHCDGVDLTEYIRVQDPQAVIFLNINSYGGGADPWNKGSRNAKVSQSFSDGLIEVVAMRSCDLACLQLGRKCKAITQCKEVTIRIDRAMPVQVDGEPSLIKPCTIKIKQNGMTTRNAKMLRRQEDKTGCC